MISLKKSEILVIGKTLEGIGNEVVEKFLKMCCRNYYNKKCIIIS